MLQPLPILFACSGRSHAGQLANQLAVTLDQRGVAEMSCLAGVGAGKRRFLRQLSGRPVWLIDGCPIHCSLGVFDQIREHVDVHIRLHDFGVRKNASLLDDHGLKQLIDKVLQFAAAQKK